MTLYYPDNQGSKLVAVTRKLDSSSTNEGKYVAAIRALMQSPQEKGLVAIIPKQTKLRGVTVKNGVARVDFSSDLTKHFSGGSTGEEMLVGSVVDTLTEFPEVEKVQFLIDGKEAETLAGHMDLTEPIARMRSLIK